MKIEKIYKGLIDIYTSNLNESFLLAAMKINFFYENKLSP